MTFGLCGFKSRPRHRSRSSRTCELSQCGPLEVFLDPTPDVSSLGKEGQELTSLRIKARASSFSQLAFSSQATLTQRSPHLIPTVGAQPCHGFGCLTARRHENGRP